MLLFMLHYIQAININSSARQVFLAPVVDPEDIFLPLLHIKVGLMGKAVKCMTREVQAFKQLR